MSASIKAQIMNNQIELVPVVDLLHIEGFSKKRVEWLVQKIKQEKIWTKPIALDNFNNLVLDGQHRMEAAKQLGLRVVPAIKYVYADIKVWSLRPKYQFDWEIVTQRAIKQDIYPYKTVKHEFPEPLPSCVIDLKDLL